MNLCQLATDWTGALPRDGAMVERKHDGWRALRFPGIDGVTRLWSRNGMPIEGTGHILHRLALMERAAGEAMFFDGEFVVGESLLATKIWCERGWRTGGEAGTFHAFDCLTLAEWRAGGSDTPLIDRKARLVSLARQVEQDPALSWDWRPGSRGRDDAGAVQIVADEWAFDASDVIDAARRVWAIDGEGVMVKDASSPYRRNRNGSWAKVKTCNAHRWMRSPIAA
jgi:ATP-dependent DNA ligase